MVLVEYKVKAGRVRIRRGSCPACLYTAGQTFQAYPFEVPAAFHDLLENLGPVPELKPEPTPDPIPEPTPVEEVPVSEEPQELPEVVPVRPLEKKPLPVRRRTRTT